MNARIALFVALLWPMAALAQGFAGLDQSADGFARPDPGTVLDFPTDHGAHPDFRIEWWYVTATLDGADGREYGVQWTLFRSATAPEERAGWQSPQLWMGHAAVTGAGFHESAERFARGGIGQAGVTAEPFSAWLDDWEMTSTAAQGDPLAALTLSARGDRFAYDLTLTTERPLILHGENGYSEKAESGEASYYYSQPFYDVAGTLALPSGPVAVTGQAWLDREWSSQPLTGDLVGWDWFALMLDDGARVMAAGTRREDGSHFTAATWITPDDTTETFPNGALRLTPLSTARVSGRDVPVSWRIELPEKGLSVTTEALNPQAWMGRSFQYWEGPIRISGSHAGRGYLEMTGYDN